MTTTVIHEVRLELVRPGPPHNQLLSPLTPYMALCGEGSPVTFNFTLEHHQLLTRLERLRYVTPENGRNVAVPARLREAEVADLGGEVGRMLSALSTLSTALARAQGNGSTTGGAPPDALVHLRLILSGSELSLVPFELAVAPQGYPGEGLEFCLQSSLPIVLTREVRRARPRAVSWNTATPPKILFVYAEPNGMTVPAQEHAHALRAAIERWTERFPSTGKAPDEKEDSRLDAVKKHLRILPNASIGQIYEECARERFTHVHVLAHGAPYQEAGVTRFGLALCGATPSQLEVVSGKALEKALRAADPREGGRSQPLIVTLATCDSGNQSDVLVPGGSIAHDLHSEGVPWVFASQFPLTKVGSVRFTENLYPRLLLGDDPREVLFEVRRLLFINGRQNHDWASIVAYGSLPDGFCEQVADFRSEQIKRAIEVALDFADKTAADAPPAASEKAVDPHLKTEVERAIDDAEDLLTRWRKGLPTGSSSTESLRRAVVSGMHGTTYKRIAFLRLAIGDDQKDVERNFRQSLHHYRRALAEAATLADKYYWTATNCLSLAAVLGGKGEEDLFDLDERLAKLDVDSSDPMRAAWAHAALAELEILKEYHTGKPGQKAKIEEHCRAIVDLMGPHSFHVGSTWRQFQRYLGPWKGLDCGVLAKAAMDVLSPDGPPRTESPLR